MAILQRCPRCHKFRKISAKKCLCGENLARLRKIQKVPLYIYYRVGGKQKKERAGYTLEEARAAEGKRLAQRHENPKILQKISDDKISFIHLMEWYFSLASVQNKTSCSQWKGQIGKFCDVFGSRAVGSLTVADLKEHQIRRQVEGMKPASIDLEIQLAGQMVRMAEMSDKISIACLKPFTRLKNLEKKGGNARTRRWEISDYVSVLPHLPRHIQQALTLAMYTGMRVTSEILNLTWKMVDWKKDFINLPAEITKARTARRIPITDQLARILKGIPPTYIAPM